MIELFARWLGLDVKKRIEESPAILRVKAVCPVCSGTGQLSFEGEMSLDFPDEKGG